MFDSRRIGLIVVLGIALAGVAQAAEEPLAIQDFAGRTVRVPRQLRSVFPAGPPAALLLFTLAPDRLLGWPTGASAEVNAFLPEKYRSLPTVGRLSGRGSTANLEDVVRLAPDLILDVGPATGASRALSERLTHQLSIPCMLLDGSLDGLPKTYRLLGGLLGVSARAERLATYIEQALAEVDRALARAPAEARPRIYYGRGPKGLETGTARSINTEVFERAGAVNVAAKAGAAGTMVQVSLEDVLRWNPQMLFCLDDNIDRTMRSSPSWQSLAAARAGRVFRMPTLPFGWVDYPPAVNRVLGLRWLAGLFHPTLFHTELRGLVREFYTLFYHRTPSEQQLDFLLRQASGQAESKAR